MRVGLVLSGGAALGAAHIGVLEVLEENGIHLYCVAGTSAGSAWSTLETLPWN
jgi:NTE family protein